MAARKMVIVIVSDYVYKGPTDFMHRWDETQWGLGSRAVAHADLWKVVLRALQRSQATMKWLWKPPHAEIEGNDRVDFLADLGRERSPLLRVPNSDTVTTPIALLSYTATPPHPVDRTVSEHATFTRVVLDITSPVFYAAGSRLCDMVIDGELNPSRTRTYSGEEECRDGGASTTDEEECFDGGGGLARIQAIL